LIVVLCVSRKYPHPSCGWSLEIPKGGEGSQRPKYFKESMKLNWNCGRGGGVQSENQPWGRYGYFWNHTFELNYTAVTNNRVPIAGVPGKLHNFFSCTLDFFLTSKVEGTMYAIYRSTVINFH